MQVRASEVSFPSRSISNRDILGMIRSSGHSMSAAEESAYLETTEKILQYAGSDNRQWLDDQETPADIVFAAMEAALETAVLSRADVDTFIYAAVSRGFLEPAESFVVAKSFGLAPDNCFDVLEACNSFSRAAEIAQLMLDCGKSRRVMIVVGEFCVNGSNYVLQNFAPTGVDELEWRFPTYTLGECATATVLTAGVEPWRFRCSARVDLAGQCTVALPHGPRYAPGIGLRTEETEIFRSFGQSMHQAAVPESMHLWNRYLDEQNDPAEIDILLPHAPSRKICEDFSEASGFPLPKIFQMFTRYGNIGSASVPVGLAVAANEGRISRGDRIACLVGAAGMSFMLYDLVY